MGQLSSGDRRNLAPAGVVTVASLIVLSAGLAVRAPLTERDAAVAASAERIAPAASDGSGRWLPLLVHGDGEMWYQPATIYPTAVLLRIGGSRELALRLPAAAAGVLTIALTYWLALRVFDRTRTAALSALLLLITPAVLVHARRGGADLMMVPPILCWCWAVLAYLERPRVWLAVAGGAVLGAAVYTQPAGVLGVPLYFSIGCAVLWCGGRALGAVLFAGLGLTLAMLPLSVWFWRYPETYLDTMGRWAVHAAHLRDPWQGVLVTVAWDALGRRAGAYWNYVSPTFLFGTGEMFGAAMAVLIPLGLFVASEPSSRLRHQLVVAGFLGAPIAAVLLDAPRTPGLALALAPFGALVGARGLDMLLADQRAWVHVGGWALLGLLILGAARLLGA